MNIIRGSILLLFMALGAGGAVAGEALLFTAEDAGHGREPWLFLNGEGRFLGDLSPGANMNAVPIPTLFSACGERIYFWADDARHGLELWQSDGGAPSFPGEFFRGFEAFLPGPGVELRDQLVFLNRPGGHTSNRFTQIWSMQAGELRCLAERSDLHGPFADGDRLLFLDFRSLGKVGSFPNVREWVLLGFDGTRLSDLVRGLTESTPNQHASVVFGGSLYTILSGTQADTTALYRIDADGAHLVVDDVSAETLVAAGSMLYGLSNSDRKLWRFDGVALTDTNIRIRGSFDEEDFVGFRDRRIQAAGLGDDLFFTSRNIPQRVTGDQVVSDPAMRGFVGLGRLKSIDGRLYWQASSRQPGQSDVRGIFRLDPEGPTLLAETSSSGNDYHVRGDRVFLGTDEHELSVNDATGQATYPLVSGNHFAEPPRDSSPQEAVEIGDWLYFRASTGPHGAELWRSDGNTAELVADLKPGSEGSSPEDLREFRGKLCFTAIADEDGWHRSVLAFDGVSAAPISGFPERVEMLRVVGEHLIVEDNGSDLWVWDGVNPPVETLFDSFSLSATGNEFLFFEGAYYFVASDGSDMHGMELWRFRDGTFEMVMDVAPGTAGSHPASVTIAGGALYWVANHPDYGQVLWNYDGTSVALVADITAGPTSASLHNLTPHGDGLVFVADTPDEGRELWITDPAGTRLLADLEPGPGSSSPAEICSVAGKLVFAAYSSAHGKELWVSRDGHTVDLLADLNPGPASSLPDLQFVEGSQCYYTAVQANDDRRLFQVNALGVSQVDCAGPKPGGRSPVYLETHLGMHWFAAAGKLGRELYRLDTAGGAKGKGSTLEFFSDLDSGPGSGNPRFLGALGLSSVFGAKSASIGEELVFVAPSPPGSGAPSAVVTWLDIAQGQELVYPRYGTIPAEVVEASGIIYFRTNSHRLFRHDGTQTSEMTLPAGSVGPRTIDDLAVIGGIVYVTLGTSSAPHTRNLLKVQGSDLVPLENGESFSPVEPIVVINGTGVLSGFDSSESNPVTGPWAIREGGVYPLEGDMSVVQPELFTPHEGWLYFLARDSTSYGTRGYLFRTDGLTLEHVDLGEQLSLEVGGGFLMSSGRNLYTVASDPNYGTPTILVLTPSGVQVPSGAMPGYTSYIDEFTPIAGNLYVKADYLPSSIYQVTPFQITQLAGTDPHHLTAGGGYLYYGASVAGYSELFTHHVASNRNSLVPNTFFAPFTTTPGDLYYANGRLYLTAARDVGVSFALRSCFEFSPPGSFRELLDDDISWLLDGGGGLVIVGDHPSRKVTVISTDGQELNTDLNFNPYDAFWFRFEDGLVTSAGHSDTGVELYFFDGDRITLLDDLVAGPESSSPENYLSFSFDAEQFQSHHPFGGWLASQGVPGQDLPELALATLQDSQGYPLLLRYATGRDLGEEPVALSVSDAGADHIVVCWSMDDAPAPGVTLTLEMSDRLVEGSWQSVASRLGSGVWIHNTGLVDLGMESGILTVTVDVPRVAGEDLYFRLRGELGR